MREQEYREKEAETAYPIEDLIRRRWSPVIFSEQAVELEKIRQLFEAARWAPSCYNEQPWAFVIGVKGQGEAWEKVFSCLVEANQKWTEQAPVLGISFARNHFARNDKPNRHAYHDVGLAMGQLSIEAVAIGLAVHHMAGFRVQQAKETLAIPEGWDPVAAFAIGYMGSVSDAADELQQREGQQRMRKSQQEFLFEGAWGDVWKGEA